MDRTRNLRVTSDLGEQSYMAGGVGEMLAIPAALTVEVDDLDWDATVSFDFDHAGRVGVSELHITRRVVTIEDPQFPGVVVREEGPLIPSRGLREFQLQGIVEQALRQVVRRVQADTSDDDLRFIDLDEPVSEDSFRLLVEGRSKSPAAVRVDRDRVVHEYEQISADYTGPDIYVEIGRRLNMGRTTVYGHLKSAGLVGRGAQ